jgi:DNA (cytosine-5)-methyltransferase 1
MRPRVYYNEHDPAACGWLRELMDKGLIPEGDIDERSIADVQPDDLRRYAQCHFFAGIGGWPLALRLAGAQDLECWTGSCPCQPFSAGGKRRGTEDERHLWPVWEPLIRECRPPIVLGEQVEDAVAHGWLDLVSSGLEAAGYACGAVAIRDRRSGMSLTQVAKKHRISRASVCRLVKEAGGNPDATVPAPVGSAPERASAAGAAQ